MLKKWALIKLKYFYTKLQSDKSDESSLRDFYNNLAAIVKEHPELSEQLFDTFKLALQSDKNNWNSLNACYYSLAAIARERPELSEQVFDTFKLALQSDKNNGLSLNACYDWLGAIIKERPELSERVFDTFKLALRSDGNIWSSLRACYYSLGAIIKERPELSEQVFDTFKLALQSDKNSWSSLEACYNCLGEVAKERPELSEQVIDAASACSDTYNKIFLYKSCMKHLPLEETIAKHPEIEQDLRVAHKGRFSTDEEFKYALKNFDKKTLAESMIFSAQQRVMNVLFVTSYMDSVAPIITENEIIQDKSETAAASYILRNMTNEELAERAKQSVELSRKSEKSSKESVAKRIETRIAQCKKEADDFRKPNASSKVRNYMDSNQVWLIPASFNGAAIFKEYFPSYIKAIQNHNKENPDDALSIHDAVYWLPEPMNKEANARFVQFIKNNIIYQNAEHKDVHRPLDQLRIIANNWEAVEKELQNQEDNLELKKLKYNYVLSVCMSVKYEDRRNDDFAIEAAEHSIPEAEYHNCEDIYLAGLKVPEPFDSKKKFKEGKYTGRFLSRDDTRTLFFGDYTNCCQYYGEVGQSCAVSTVKHPFSQLFVIEDDKGKIIAGSWTWENTEGKYREVCFDNIEIKGDFSKDTVKRMKNKRESTILEIYNYLEYVKTSKLVNLWKDYWQAVRDCDKDINDASETKEKISHLIDVELQSKELRKHEFGEILVKKWKEHKSAQEHYENHKRVYDAITSLYAKAGQYLTKEQNCHKVTIGLGYQDADVSGYASTEAIPLPKLYGHNYTDARRQVLLAENSSAKPLDKTQETQRYIRDVCFLDKEAMDKISYTVFPDSDRELQLPDDMSGFVIEDREKGVVGYCLYDKEEKEIFDMAVLPEYRKDKNASSRKLFAEMMRVINKEGGQWSAEMRDKTTLRYLKAMAKRGLVKYEEHGIDHIMSDGSKVVRVTFTPAQNNMRQTINKLRNQVSPDKENDRTYQQNNAKQNSGIVISEAVRE